MPKSGPTTSRLLPGCGGCCGWHSPPSPRCCYWPRPITSAWTSPAVPFLWVAPLSLYLLSFIIAFDHQRWYRRMPFALAALFTVYSTAILSNPTAWGNWMSGLHGLSGSLASTSWLPHLGYWQGLCLQLAVLFLRSMLCHGELVRLRPSARYLTSFYLMISAGAHWAVCRSASSPLWSSRRTPNGKSV